MPENAPVKMEGFADGMTMAQKIQKWDEWSKTQEKPIPITKDVANRLSVAGQKLNQAEDKLVELFSKGKEESAVKPKNKLAPDSSKDGLKDIAEQNPGNPTSVTPITEEVSSKMEQAKDAGDSSSVIAEQNPSNPTSVTRNATSGKPITEEMSNATSGTPIADEISKEGEIAKDEGSVAGDVGTIIAAAAATQKETILDGMELVHL